MCESALFHGVLSTQEIFFYPDMEFGILPTSIHLDMPLDGKPGIQLLIQTQDDSVQMHLDGPGFSAEYYSMQAIPVEYNTSDGTQQGGAMVFEQTPLQKPDYASRLAPFEVFDCLTETPNGCISAHEGFAAAYLCLNADACITPGTYSLMLCVHCREGEYRCKVDIRIYDVHIPHDTFPVTNWFSLGAIQRLHNVKEYTPAYYEMIRRYAQAMRRAHQTMFFLHLDPSKSISSHKPLQFSFEYLRPLIECFFSVGMQTIELGTLLTRGKSSNGFPEPYTDILTCAFNPALAVDSPEGYAQMSQFISALAAFLKKNGWDSRVLIHILDEPDVFCPDEQTLSSRRRQYLLTANILRRCLPNVHIIEAVESTAFYGGVDIWVPLTSAYEYHREDFSRLIALGESVWTYVCCAPRGRWLNRFLDQPLLHGRLLFWGCAANRIGGYLHWGFNQFPDDMDPFLGTSCKNSTEDGTNYPCGDCFIVYPGKDGPLLSMRLEASRRGAEDAALLAMLRKHNEAAHDALIARIFTDNRTYNDDPAVFAEAYAQMLALLEQYAKNNKNTEIKEAVNINSHKGYE